MAGLCRRCAPPAGACVIYRPSRGDFTGAYSSYEAAFATAKTMPMAGYDHEEIASVGFSKMCQVLPWDYPVMFWMRNLMEEIDGVIDAGGHI